MPTVIVGGGAFARELACWASDAGLEPVGYLDDAGETLGARGYDLQYLGAVTGYSVAPGDQLLLAVGEPSIKEQIVLSLGASAHYASVVHPSAVIARTARLGRGVILGPQSYVAADADIGDFVTINSLTGIGHDAVVGAYSTISSQVDLTGHVQLGQGVFVGSGARVLPKVKVGDGARIGAGSIAVRTVKAGSTVYAAPARKL